ncbi:MAG: hypothetical protein LBL26_09690, partial [Peptococcaceae bacterium]|nr:hypothetical protein [Peptococcaceae bacterium]
MSYDKVFKLRFVVWRKYPVEGEDADLTAPRFEFLRLNLLQKPNSLRSDSGFCGRKFRLEILKRS